MPSTPRNKLPLRSHVPARIYDVINNRRCIHRDAYLVQDGDDTLYFVIEERMAGQELVNTIVMRADVQTLALISYNGRFDEASLVSRHINSPWALKRYGNALNLIHARHIQPIIRKRDAGALPPSVILHYVWLDPSIGEPTHGLSNMYDGSARDHAATARRTRPIRERAPMPAVEQPAERIWNPRERSLLRTINKLLKS